MSVRLLAHPLRIAGGQFACVDQDSIQQAQQMANAVVSTRIGERLLAPDFGINDPAGVGLTRSEVVAAINLSEPALVVRDVSIHGPIDGRQRVDVTVAWADDLQEV